MVGGLYLRQLNQRDAQGPDVCLVVIGSVLRGLAHDHFGGHPGGHESQRTPFLQEADKLPKHKDSAEQNRQEGADSGMCYSPVWGPDEGISSLKSLRVLG